jgi:hypothetical protein
MKIRAQIVAAIVTLSSFVVPQSAEAAPLYKFSSHTFTNCGATGRSGPLLTQCRSAYSATSWASNSSYLNVSGGIESWTAPATGTYEVTAAGAAGVGAGIARGLGAIIRARVTLTKGSVYRILVGQAGSNGTGGSGGGGGGTFFTDASNTPIVVAGGGGGATNDIGSTATVNGQTTTSGASNSDSTIAGGTSGGGANGGTWTGGGAGFTGNGGQPSSGAGYPGYALSFINGGTGGPTAQGAFGGFGGGGGTHGNTGGGGGGGGYSGGAAGPNYTATYNGGGGGSFVAAGATDIATSNGSYAGSSTGITNLNSYNGTYASSTVPHGYLTITYLNAITVQVTSVSGGNIASYRTPFQIQATLSQAGGRVTFYALGKVIGACNNLTTSGTTVTCNWMPSVKGAITITAFVTPNSDTLGSTSPPLALLVGARSSRR